ncbi:unnamed protein product, partial [Nesidiocoris tenuis]
MSSNREGTFNESYTAMPTTNPFSVRWGLKLTSFWTLIPYHGFRCTALPRHHVVSCFQDPKEALEEFF